jgi:hypothetical protein
MPAAFLLASEESPQDLKIAANRSEHVREVT